MICWTLLVLLAALHVHVPVVVTTMPDVTLSHTTPSGQRVMVLDNVISLKSAAALRSYVMRFSNWKLYDIGQEGNATSDNNCVRHWKFPWIAKMPVTFFENTCLWKNCMRLPVLDNYLSYDVQADILRRGDSIKVQCGLDKEGHNDEYSWRVFLTPDWQINDYGDLTFYHGDIHRGKPGPVLTITPRMGRIVLWDSSLSSLYHPPSMGYIQGLLSVTGKLTTNKDKYSAYKNQQKELDNQHSVLQPSFPVQYPDRLELTAKYTRSFNDSKGRRVAVYDNVFPRTDLAHLRHALLTEGEINYMPYDIQREEDVDNTQWIKTYDPDKLTESALWDVLHDVMVHVSGNRTSWHPYDVSLNIVRSADHTRIHQDCDEWEDEYTMVLYLNPNWCPEFYGETVFFEAIPGTELSRQLYGPNGDTEYQPFAAVLPKYGRLAVFQGIIPHSARPPSTMFTGARYTLAVKVSLTRRIALTKRLQETLEDSFDGLSTDEQQLLEDLISGDYNHETSFRSEQWLEQTLQDALRKAAKVRQNHKTKMEDTLFTACD